MSIDFRIKDFFYPRQIWNLHRRFETNQWLPTRELEAYQLKRLKLILSHAFDQVPYYRQLFNSIDLHPSDISSLKDFRQIPLLQKETIKQNLKSLQARDFRRYSPIETQTSGSSGQPLRFFQDRSSQALEFVYYWRYWGWAGYRLGHLFAELTSHFFLIRSGMSDRDTFLQPHLRRLLLNSNHLSKSNCLQMATQIRKHHARFLKGISSSLYFFALNLREAGISDIRFEAVFSTGEVVTPMHRRLIEDVFQAPLFDSYGHMERTVAISQCPAGSYHVHSDYGVLEVDTCEQRVNGDKSWGRVIGTSLHNFAMPLIRYDTGDRVETFTNKEYCQCGRTLPLIRALHGREEDTLVTPDGRFITALFIVPEFISNFDYIQFVQVSKKQLEVRIVPGQHWNETESTRLSEFTRRMVGDSLNIRIRKILPEKLISSRSGKIRSVINQCV